LVNIKIRIIARLISFRNKILEAANINAPKAYMILAFASLIILEKIKLRRTPTRTKDVFKRPQLSIDPANIKTITGSIVNVTPSSRPSKNTPWMSAGLSLLVPGIEKTLFRSKELCCVGLLKISVINV